MTSFLSSSSKPIKRITLFAFAVVMIYALEIGIVKNACLFAPPSVPYGAVAADLTLFVPLLYYWFVVRPQKQSPLSVLPVFLVSLFAASLVLPHGQQETIHRLRLIALPAELLSLGGSAWLIGKAFWTASRHRTGEHKTITDWDDWGERLHTSMDAAARNGQPAPVWVRAFCDEIVMGYFSLVAWRIETPPATARAFTYHQKNGWGGMLFGIVAMLLFEVPAEHYLLAQWSKPLAWLMALGSVYFLVWLWADWQAIRLRPILCDDDVLKLRIGLRWRVLIPYQNITEIREVLSHPKRRVPGGHLKATVWGQPNLRLHLSEPVAARGPAGMMRRVQYVSLFVDEPKQFVQVLEQMLDQKREADRPA